MTTSEFQPYRAGWDASPARLVSKVTAATTAVTAATVASRADRTGTDCGPEPGSTAFLVPTTATAGRSPSTASRLSSGAVPGRRSGRGHTSRAAITVSMTSRSPASRSVPGPRITQLARNPRSGSNRATGPTGASGDRASAPATDSTAPPRTGISPGPAAVSAAWA